MSGRKRKEEVKIIDLHSIISTYNLDKDSQTKSVLQVLEDSMCEQEKDGAEIFTIDRLRSEIGLADFTEVVKDTVKQWKSRNKNNAVNILRQFTLYLETEYQIELLDDAFPRDIPDATERLLDMLKFLHKPRTRDELMERYLISERTLRNDLNTLEKGWTILGNKIKIYCDNGPAGKISYNSTVHPLLLALNLTEVYTLTVGLKEMAKGTVYQDVAGYLADAVYSQLSDYGEKILAGTGQNNLRQISPRYRQERPVLEQSRGANLIYLMKQGQRCRIEYDNGSGVVNNVEGVPTVPPGRVRTVGILGTELQIPLDRIIMITPLENYR